MTRKPWVWQGASVKKGQTLAYIEQLGTFVPVEVGVAFFTFVICICHCKPCLTWKFSNAGASGR